MTWCEQLDALIDQRLDEIIALRRHLHAHPEPSEQEFETSLHLYQLVSQLQLPVQMGPDGRGVIVDCRAAAETNPRRVALRGDIDALRIQDQKQVPYCSQKPGVMHACGHDAHSAILYGTISALDQLERQGHLPWPVTWRAIFQPAEETCTGARDMTAAGAVDDVGAIFALHVDPTRRAGDIGVRPGAFTASCDDLEITIHGRGGHGARPHESKDPIAAAAQLINILYQFVPRATDSQEAVVVSVAQIHGGENANVIPERVELSGTLRTLDAQVRQRTIEQIHSLARGMEQVTGTRIEVRLEASVPSVYNDVTLTSLVSRVAEQLLGPEHVAGVPRPSMGSEDFAMYLEKVPGTMFRLGAASDIGPAPGLHTPTFDIDERCLAIGAKVLARAAVEWSRPVPEFEI